MKDNINIVFEAFTEGLAQDGESLAQIVEKRFTPPASFILRNRTFNVKKEIRISEKPSFFTTWNFYRKAVKSAELTYVIRLCDEKNANVPGSKLGCNNRRLHVFTLRVYKGKTAETLSLLSELLAAFNDRILTDEAMLTECIKTLVTMDFEPKKPLNNDKNCRLNAIKILAGLEYDKKLGTGSKYAFSSDAMETVKHVNSSNTCYDLHPISSKICDLVLQANYAKKASVQAQIQKVKEQRFSTLKLCEESKIDDETAKFKYLSYTKEIEHLETLLCELEKFASANLSLNRMQDKNCAFMSIDPGTVKDFSREVSDNSRLFAGFADASEATPIEDFLLSFEENRTSGASNMHQKGDRNVSMHEKEQLRSEKMEHEARLRMEHEARLRMECESSRQSEYERRKREESRRATEEQVGSQGAAPDSVDVSQVQFSAVSPKKLEKGDYAIIDVYMYEEQFNYIVNRALDEAEQPAKATTSGFVQAKLRSRVKVVLTSPDIEIDDNVSECDWNGRYQKFSFDVYLPEDYAKKKILFNASVYVDGIIATKLKFLADCESTEPIRVEKFDVMRAFVSYASQDRNTVTMIVQGLRKARPNMQIFFDVETLRSGQRWEEELRRNIDLSDVLFLCWSHFAKESKWVDYEWRYALDNKGIDFIEPIPLEPPINCQPPDELSSKHFNDLMLYIRKE